MMAEPQPSADSIELLALATNLARRAGAVLRENLGTASLVATKSSSTDAVTEVDHASEAVIVDGLRLARPDDGVLGEEGSSISGTSGIQWIVDPLDGTVNYLYGHPSGWCVSIAADDGAGPLVGAVYDPARDELFAASRGGGATLNGTRIAVSSCTDFSQALLATGFSYQAAQRKDQGELLARLLPAVRDVRRVGSAALDLCGVACGRLDVYYEYSLHYWDWAAGSLIVREAGGRCEHGDDRILVATPPALFDQLRSRL